MRIMLLNKILIVGCLMLGFPVASSSAPFNPDDLFTTVPKPSAAGAFRRTVENIANANKAAESRQLIELANAKIAKDPDNDRYIAARAQCHQDLGEYDLALADINKAIQLKPSEQSYFVLRGAIKLGKNEDISALNDFNKALSIGPATSDIYERRACVLFLLNRYPDGMIDANKAVSMDSNSAGALATRGTAKIHLHDYAGADADCVRAEALAHDRLDVKNLRAMLTKVKSQSKSR